jgi:hypothetical protein
MNALIKTAEAVSVEQSKWAKDMDAFLEYIVSRNGEVYLQLGMLADAADEALLVTRIFDDECSDTATAVEDLAIFQERVHALFGSSEGCFHLQGFTQFAAEFVETARVVKIRGVIAGVLGPGFSRQVKDACLARMRCWLQLCKVVIQAEFPDFEIAHTFSDFHLGQKRKHRGGDDDAAETDRHFQRLGLLFGLEWQDLRDQYNDYLPIARKHYTELRCSNLDAWRDALARPWRGHDCRALKHVFLRYSAYGTSTTGVEHTFATAKRELAHCSSTSDRDGMDFAYLKLLRDKPQDPQDLALVVGTAREIWAQAYGAVRRRREFVSRIDKGIGYSERHMGADSDRHTAVMGPDSDRHPAVMGQPKSAAEWLQRRRGATASAAREMPMPAACSDENAKPEGWTDRHEKEATFQRNKRLSRRIDSFARGQLLESEIDDELKQQAEMQGKNSACRTWQHGGPERDKRRNSDQIEHR